MNSLAPILQKFFTDRLIKQRRVSPNTVAAYRDTFRLLLNFAQEQTKKPPSKLDLADLDAPLIGAFLGHLEHVRGNSAQTRNGRLAAVHSLFRFAALEEPSSAALIQRVLAIPQKRSERNSVSFLTREEIDAILSSPDVSCWVGRRDHALLLVAIQTGFRVSELIGTCCKDVSLGKGAHIRCRGKGRKERCTPLTIQSVSVLRVWLRERDGLPDEPLFPSRRGGFLSRDAVEKLVAKYAAEAVLRCPSLGKKRVSPHVLRHSAAMQPQLAGVDSSVIALWLGHESIQTTQIYLHADMSIKQRALDRVVPPNSAPGRYRANDSLLEFLESL